MVECRCQTSPGYWVRATCRALTRDEIAWAKRVARARYASVESRPESNRGAVMTGAQGFTSHFKGALGELAYCILFGIPWPARVDTFTGPPDVDPDIEIKTSGFGPHLMARPKDVTEHAGRRFVAMSFDKPERTFRCYGWCWGRELAEAPLRDPGGWGKPVHWLEAHDLHRLPMALRHTTREPKESHA